jgi:hypothetical protein
VYSSPQWCCLHFAYAVVQSPLCKKAQTIAFSRHAKAEKGNLVISRGKIPRKSQQSMPSPIKDGSDMGGKQAGSGSVNRTSQHR